MPSKIKKIHQSKKTAVLDNSYFKFKDIDEDIQNEYFDKWIKAFLTTKDPMKWLQRRKHSSKLLIAS